MNVGISNQPGSSLFVALADHVHELDYPTLATVLLGASFPLFINFQQIQGLADGTAPDHAVNVDQLTTAIASAVASVRHFYKFSIRITNTVIPWFAYMGDAGSSLSAIADTPPIKLIRYPVSQSLKFVSLKTFVGNTLGGGDDLSITLLRGVLDTGLQTSYGPGETGAKQSVSAGESFSPTDTFDLNIRANTSLQDWVISAELVFTLD